MKARRVAGWLAYAHRAKHVGAGEDVMSAGLADLAPGCTAIIRARRLGIKGVALARRVLGPVSGDDRAVRKRVCMGWYARAGGPVAGWFWCIPVSYTHLTLPTSDLV